MIGAVLGLPRAETEARLVSLVGACSNSRVAVRQSSGLVAAGTDTLADSGAEAWVGRPRSGHTRGGKAHLQGDFSLISIDGDDELSLTRGFFGGRPLFYTRSTSDRSLTVCSGLTPLVTTLSGLTLDRERLASFVLKRPLRDHGRTFYRQIRRAPSASVLRVGADGVRAQIAMPLTPVRPSEETVDGLAAELREYVRAAVRRSMAGAVRVGVSTSGGLDSSYLLATAMALAREENRPDVGAFNLRFAGAGDDRPHFDRLCKALGVVPYSFEPREYSGLLENAFVADSAPLAGPTSAFDIGMTRLAAERGVTAFMTGMGGDEFLTGDMGVFGERAMAGHVVWAIRAAATLKAWGNSTVRTRLQTLVLRPIIRSFAPTLGRRTQEVPWAGPLLRKFEAEEIFEDRRMALGFAGPNGLETLARSAQLMDYSDIRGQLEVAGSCQRIDPYMDEDLLGFVSAVDPEILFHEGWVRGLFRHAIRGEVPESIRLRSDKASFEPALVELISAAGGFGVLEALVRMNGLADLGLVEPRAFRQRFDELVACPEDGRLWVELWPVLAAEAFVRGTAAQA